MNINNMKRDGKTSIMVVSNQSNHDFDIGRVFEVNSNFKNYYAIIDDGKLKSISKKDTIIINEQSIKLNEAFFDKLMYLKLQHNEFSTLSMKCQGELSIAYESLATYSQKTIQIIEELYFIYRSSYHETPVLFPSNQ